MAASFESFSLYWKPDVMTTRLLCTLLRSVLIWTLLAIGNAGDRLVDVGGTIAFASVGRPYYAFDVFAVSLPQSWSSSDSLPLSPNLLKETRLTDGVSINYNGHFVEGSERRALEDFLSPQARHDEDSNKGGVKNFVLVSIYVISYLCGCTDLYILIVITLKRKVPSIYSSRILRSWNVDGRFETFFF